MQEVRYEDQNEVLLRGASCVDIKLELYFKPDRRIANSRGMSTAFVGLGGIFLCAAKKVFATLAAVASGNDNSPPCKDSGVVAELRCALETAQVFGWLVPFLRVYGADSERAEDCLPVASLRQLKLENQTRLAVSRGDSGLKIAILSRNPKLYSTRRLVEAATALGHEVQVVDALECYMNINMQQPEIHVKGLVLPHFDAVIPRIGASVTFYGTAVLRQFEMMGTYPLNESVAISRSRDKLRSMQLLSRKGIGLPVTGFANKPADIPDLIEMVGGAPLVIKLLEGTQGIGVVLAETRQAAESVLEAFMGIKASVMVQEYIKEAGGADIRCFVIGDKVIAAMKRQGKPGEFRSNLHRGGSASLVRLTPQERSTAVRAARTMGLNVAGVDILRSNHGPLVMEVNSSPGLEGIERATGLDVATRIIEFIEKTARVNRTSTRGRG
jgi:ribosomal protein S6--L-glutamate ligase